MRIRIVGMGITGITLAYLLKKNHCVTINEKYAIGGQCREDEQDGIWFHEFGPHIFHTNNEEIKKIVDDWGGLNDYEHRVNTLVNGKLVSWPVDKNTFEALPKPTQDLILYELDNLDKYKEEFNKNQNFETKIMSLVGPTLYSLFIKEYTRKQWGRDPRELDHAWAPNRIHLRLDDTHGKLFTDKYQGCPKVGYNEWFDKALWDSPGNKIDGHRAGFHSNIYDMLKGSSDHDFYIVTAPIDEFYQYKFCKLEWRGLEFENRTLDTEYFYPRGVINIPGKNLPFTRINEYKHMTKQEHKKTLIQFEYPNNSTRYYPMQTRENQYLAEKYIAHASNEYKVIFAGRLGLYQYINMDQAIEQAIEIANNIDSIISGNLSKPELYNRIRRKQ